MPITNPPAKPMQAFLDVEGGNQTSPTDTYQSANYYFASKTSGIEHVLESVTVTTTKDKDVLCVHGCLAFQITASGYQMVLMIYVDGEKKAQNYISSNGNPQALDVSVVIENLSQGEHTIELKGYCYELAWRHHYSCLKVFTVKADTPT